MTRGQAALIPSQLSPVGHGPAPVRHGATPILRSWPWTRPQAAALRRGKRQAAAEERRRAAAALAVQQQADARLEWEVGT